MRDEWLENAIIMKIEFKMILKLILKIVKI